MSSKEVLIMALTEQRKGEIALAVLEDKADEHGFTVSKNSRRELGGVSKRTGIKLEELLELSREFSIKMATKHLT